MRSPDRFFLTCRQMLCEFKRFVAGQLEAVAPFYFVIAPFNFLRKIFTRSESTSSFLEKLRQARQTLKEGNSIGAGKYLSRVVFAIYRAACVGMIVMQFVPVKR